jgi:hypothetical protein
VCPRWRRGCLSAVSRWRAMVRRWRSRTRRQRSWSRRWVSPRPSSLMPRWWRPPKRSPAGPARRRSSALSCCMRWPHGYGRGLPSSPA